MRVKPGLELCVQPDKNPPIRTRLALEENSPNPWMITVGCEAFDSSDVLVRLAVGVHPDSLLGVTASVTLGSSIAFGEQSDILWQQTHVLEPSANQALLRIRIPRGAFHQRLADFGTAAEQDTDSLPHHFANVLQFRAKDYVKNIGILCNLPE